MYIALKVSSDVWKNNVLSQKSQRACTTFKNILGSEWNTFFNPFETRNINNCPLTPVLKYYKYNIKIMSEIDLRQYDIYVYYNPIVFTYHRFF